MANNGKPSKKDQQTARDTRDELFEEIHPTGTKPQHANPNRDRARGDWDRSGIHHDADPERPED